MNRKNEIVSRLDAEKTVHLIRRMTARADLKTVEGTGEFVGYASTFDPPSEPDRANEIVNPRAFDGTLARWRNRKTWPPLVFHHEWSVAGTVGVVTDMYTNARGLVVHGRLDLDHEPAAALYAAMKAGRITGMSFAFDVLNRRTLSDGIVELLELELLEVSIAVVPANANAQILAVKSAPLEPEESEIARINRELDRLAAFASGERPHDPDAASAVDELILEVRQEFVQEALDRAEQAAWEEQLLVSTVLDPVPVRVDARMRPDR